MRQGEKDTDLCRAYFVLLAPSLELHFVKLVNKLFGESLSETGAKYLKTSRGSLIASADCDWTRPFASVADLVSSVTRRVQGANSGGAKQLSAARMLVLVSGSWGIASHVDSLKHECQCTQVTFNGMAHRRN